MFRVDRLGVIEVCSDGERADLAGGRVGASVDPRTGFLHGVARVARTGVQTYSDGSRSWGEYRDPAEVFAPDSLASYRGSVWTDKHPAEFVTADNVKDLQIGHSGDEIGQDGRWVTVPFTITDKAVIDRAKAGQVQLSAGYWQRPVIESGTHDGEAYTVKQTAIRINHIAAVDAARAGPEAEIPAIDSIGGFQIPAAVVAGAGEKMSEKKQADKAETVIEAPKAAEIKAPAQAPGTPTADAAQIARLDVLAAENEALRARLDARDKADAERAHAEIVAQASKLAPALVCDGLTTSQIQSAIVASLQPSLSGKVKDAAPEIVAAYFDAATAAHAQKQEREQGERDAADLRSAGLSAPADAFTSDLRDAIAFHLKN